MTESQNYNNVALLVGHIIADCPNPAVPTTYVKKEKQCFNCQQYVTYTEREALSYGLFMLICIGPHCKRLYKRFPVSSSGWKQTASIQASHLPQLRRHQSLCKGLSSQRYCLLQLQEARPYCSWMSFSYFICSTQRCSAHGQICQNMLQLWQAWPHCSQLPYCQERKRWGDGWDWQWDRSRGRRGRGGRNYWFRAIWHRDWIWTRSSYSLKLHFVINEIRITHLLNPSVCCMSYTD